jgi:phage terminase large subunit-like protein
VAALEDVLRGVETETQLRERDSAVYDWRRKARPEQIAPAGEWVTWLYLAGRGSGKTRSGAEWVRERATAESSRGAIVCPTAADVRDVAIEGECGLLAVSPPWDRPEYEPSKRRLTWRNGSTATLFSADEPDRLRGFSFEWAWADELGAWRRMRAAWDNLNLCMRKGGQPQVCVTTTPRPLALIGEMVSEARKQTGRVVATTGTVYDNRANLSPVFFEQIVSRYEGTSLAAQELLGEYLASLPGALWTRDLFRHGVPPELSRVIVAVDPAVSSGDRADETGIMVCGVDSAGLGWVLGDYSLRGSPADWVRAVARACADFDAQGIVAERNQGGLMVEHVLLSSGEQLPPIELVFASKSKGQRAEPVALLYEQGKVYHAEGADLEELEQQLCLLCRDGYGGAGSPDRADAAVHGLASLVVEGVARGEVGGFIVESPADSIWKPLTHEGLFDWGAGR